MIKYEFDDGGRAEAGFKGRCGDCGTRAAAIALGLPYKEVYDELNAITKEMHNKARTAKMKKYFSGSVRDGTAVEVMHEFMARHNWEWVSTMRIGSGCYIHLEDMANQFLVEGDSFVCRLAGHYCAVVNGTIRDTFEDRGDRCVYGYWRVRE